MLSLYDLFRAGVLVIGFAIGKRDRKTAMLADLVFTAWLGVGLFIFPHQAIGLPQVSKTAYPALTHVVRKLAALLIGPLYMLYYSRNSRDDSVIGAVLWSRSLGMFPLIMVMIHGQMVTDLGNNKALWSGVFFFACVWISNIVQLVLARPSVGRREQKGAVGVLCRLLFLYMFLAGLLYMSFPKLILNMVAGTKDMNSTVTYLVRITGSLTFSGIFVSWYAPCFRQNEARKAYFISLLITAGLTIAAHVLNNVVEGCSACKNPPVCLGLAFFPTVLPALGLFLTYRPEGNNTN